MRDHQTVQRAGDRTLTSSAIAMLSLALLPMLSGCEQPVTPGGLPTATMPIGKRTFTLEIARTPEQQQTGLMNRDSMSEDHGMIFVFPDQQTRSFWMKNTRFALDIVFLDKNGKIVSIHQMMPYSLRQTSSDAPAEYAIELNRGAADAAGVKVGDKLDVPAPARSSTR